MMRPTRQSKNAFIQSLLVRGRKPKAEVLASSLTAKQAGEMEARLIAHHKAEPWNCNTGNGAEGVTPGALHSVYALREPWHDGRIFYIGIAVDVAVRLRSHIQEAKETTITLTKKPNLARFLQWFLNGCPNTGEILDGGDVSHCFFRTPADYLRSYYCQSPNIACTEEDLLLLDCGWHLHGWLDKADVLRIMAAMKKRGLKTYGNGR